jgi:hypothetical protein
VRTDVAMTDDQPNECYPQRCFFLLIQLENSLIQIENSSIQLENSLIQLGNSLIQR